MQGELCTFHQVAPSTSNLQAQRRRGGGGRGSREGVGGLQAALLTRLGAFPLSFFRFTSGNVPRRLHTFHSSFFHLRSNVQFRINPRCAFVRVSALRLCLRQPFFFPEILPLLFLHLKPRCFFFSGSQKNRTSFPPPGTLIPNQLINAGCTGNFCCRIQLLILSTPPPSPNTYTHSLSLSPSHTRSVF